MNTIRVFPERESITSSMFSSAALLPFSGWLPAPIPSVSDSPIWTFTGTGLLGKSLMIGVADNEIYIPDTFFEHVVDSIVPASANSKDLDYRRPFDWQIKIHYIVWHSVVF